MHVSDVYGNDPSAIWAARQTAASFIARISQGTLREISADVADTVQLVVSELVTNAVKHAPGRFGMELVLAGQVLEISVWDTSPLVPTAVKPDPARVGRNGMEIVTALCGGFEVTHTTTGKRITARVALSAA
ncbi:ATP-binding protein [Streptomyces sp. NPDC002574]|uniref:ATP-binding protein n=1 Tax=Streptomyces sp. NPDC002574 TaxID=3364652 RepID=UPI0036A33329